VKDEKKKPEQGMWYQPKKTTNQPTHNNTTNEQSFANPPLPAPTHLASLRLPV
jgi:hypothetical protein